MIFSTSNKPRLIASAFRIPPSPPPRASAHGSGDFTLSTRRSTCDGRGGEAYFGGGEGGGNGGAIGGARIELNHRASRGREETHREPLQELHERHRGTQAKVNFSNLLHV